MVSQFLQIPPSFNSHISRAVLAFPSAPATTREKYAAQRQATSSLKIENMSIRHIRAQNQTPPYYVTQLQHRMWQNARHRKRQCKASNRGRTLLLQRETCTYSCVLQRSCRKAPVFSSESVPCSPRLRERTQGLRNTGNNSRRVLLKDRAQAPVPATS